MSNLMLPGNPRYQPTDLQDIFGYDHLFRAVAEVEIATLRTLHEIGVISDATIAVLTPEMEQKLLAITTSEVDEVERKVTKHDIRAWVKIAQGIVGPDLGRWIHVPLTSYDALDTARALLFTRAHSVIYTKIREVVQLFVELVMRYAGTTQIGRTHGQHALPITVGFWLATILNRILDNWEKMNEFSSQLTGKISGAVGAYNAQASLGIIEKAGGNFESKVLRRLELRPAFISTQILPPEQLSYYLFSCTMLSAAFGQFGRDCRQLMRTEIGELCEPFEKDQVGSSTMAHKRNPLNFENLEGTWIKNRNAFGLVLDTLICEHQRDLVGSTVLRDLPVIIVNLLLQLNTLLRKGPDDKAFLARITVDEEACQRNLALQGDFILAEPIFIALQMAGYRGDAHHLINHEAINFAKFRGGGLWPAVRFILEGRDAEEVLSNIPPELLKLFESPEKYIGLAREKATAVALRAMQMACLS